MSFKSCFYASAAMISFLGFVPLAPAQAGQLFPPSNIGANPNVTCPSGQVLGWTGDAVACTNPTPGVTTTACPTGQQMVQISGGTPVCANPTPGVTVSCPSGSILVGITNGAANCLPSPAIADTVTVSCPSGDVLTGITNGAANCVALPAGTSTSSTTVAAPPALLPYPSAIACPLGSSQTFPFKGLSNGVYTYGGEFSNVDEADAGTATITYDATTGALLNVYPSPEIHLCPSTLPSPSFAF